LYVYGLWLVSQNITDFTGFMMTLMSMFGIAVGVGMAGQFGVDSAKAKRAMARILQIMNRNSKLDPTVDQGVIPSGKLSGQIEFKEVGFSYPTRPDTKIYDGFTLTIEAGTTVALVGGSGSGKSTAVQLIERFYDVDHGSLTIDGVDIRNLQLKWIRKQVGLVGQEPILFSGSIAENISWGRPDATPEEIEQAARMSNAHEFISLFPDGYATKVGQSGSQLSGGQKQRIAIARAIIKNPSILLLDEATSALDTESERVVQDALDKLLKLQRRTTVVIAHRLSTIRDADKIAVVHGGKVAEQGTHFELIQDDDGLYTALVSASGGIV